MKKFLMSVSVILTFLVFLGSQANASSTLIRSHVAAVQIIVVDEDHTITQIYRNSNQQVVPDVRLLSANGQNLAYSTEIASQYQKIVPSLADGSIGKVYDQPKLPSLIETLYAML